MIAPPRTSAVDACEDTLRRRILGGELAVGARLPPERELAVSLGASRVTMRSALARLADANLLSVRQGSGYFVRDFHRDGGPDLLFAIVGLARGPDVAAIVADLLLVRRKLASAVLERWLTIRPSARALAHFEAAIDELATRVDADADAAAIAEADVEIVARLVHATKSPVLELCLNPIVAVLRELPALRDAMYASPTENVVGWRALASWLRARDASTLALALAELERRDAATVARLRRRGPA